MNNGVAAQLKFSLGEQGILSQVNVAELNVLLPSLPLVAGERWGDGSAAFWLCVLKALGSNARVTDGRKANTNCHSAGELRPRAQRNSPVHRKTIVKCLAFARDDTTLKRVA
ncbi:MAG: hypothetical protein JO354_02695 [Verrucomicrobia bacterium]|nr:hypothetical protein [Verrucomicrobiota bacterium]